ncbi:MAG: hypothetical protein Fur0037_12050 [Planctomycetota bacterium]
MRSTILTAAVVTLSAFCTPISAQGHAVAITEIMPGGQDPWIELWNSGAAPADLSAWTLYLATDTPFRPQTYFFGFPQGTVMPADSRLLVHWLAPRPPQPAPGEIWTGETVYHFLFGLGAEPLPAAAGALGLIRSQSNSLMNTASLFEDWVSWGRSGFARESTAVQAGIWTTGSAAPAIPPGSSLARVESAIGGPTAPALQWFADPTPTPLEANVPGSSLLVIGSPCVTNGNHLFGPPALVPVSYPVPGNQAFALRVENTSGLLFESVVLAFGAAAAPQGLPSLLPPSPGSACPVLLDPARLFAAQWFPARPLRTELPLGLGQVGPAAAGVRFLVQALVLDRSSSFPPYQGTSNALEIRLGN